MTISSIIIVFFINWLILFFIFLPFYISIPRNHILGHANSSPKKTYLLQKTVLSFFTSFLTSSFTILLIKKNFFLS